MAKGARPGYLSKVILGKKKGIYVDINWRIRWHFSGTKTKQIKANTMRGPKSIVHGHKAREYVIKVEKMENGNANGSGNRAANEADADPSCGFPPGVTRTTSGLN